MPHMENPAHPGGAPKSVDIAASNIASDYMASLHQQQAAQLARRHPLSLRMAAIVAPLVFGENGR